MLYTFSKFIGILSVLCGAANTIQADQTPHYDAPVFYKVPPKIPPRPVMSALSAAGRGDWAQAEALAERAGPGAVVMIRAEKLLSGGGTLQDVLEFGRTYPEWPKLEKMRTRVEAQLADAPPEEVLQFFRDTPPQTGTGTLLFAKAAEKLGKTDFAQTQLVKGWRSLDLTTAEHEAFMKNYANLLAPHHKARLDMALWRGLKDVQLMLPLVSENSQRLAEIRLKLKNKPENIEELLETLSKADQRNPGIAYELFNYYIDTDKTDKAIELILLQSKIKDGLGQPERWARWRNYLARSNMGKMDATTVYQLAATHQLSEGSKYAELEWLAGYVALTYLKDPQTAVKHFQNLTKTVKTPISLGRGWYWTGRSYEALGEVDKAQDAYTQGAAYQSSYYGLLAAEKVNAPFDLDITSPTRVRGHDLSSNALYQAAYLMWGIGETGQSLKLLYGLADKLPESELPHLGLLVEEWETPYAQVKLGKRLARRSIILARQYYPLHPLAEMDLPVSAELSLAIARRESEFNPLVRSSAGAEGLMQLMPGTSKDVARDIGIEYERDKVLADWQYNALLGSTYLAGLAERFDGNIVMIAAGYNAGPGRPVQWMEQLGDPRKSGGMDIVDWVEHIPFSETRNYVMRVSESLPVYRKWLGKETLPQPFSAELAGKSIKVKFEF